jgi:transcription elongation factor Elf1
MKYYQNKNKAKHYHHHHHHHHHSGKGHACPVCGSYNLKTTYSGSYYHYVTCKRCSAEFEIEK